MRKTNHLFVIFLLISFTSHSQQVQQTDSILQNYRAAQRVVSRSFSSYFYPNRNQLFSLTEKAFVNKIDSLRNGFEKGLITYKRESSNANPAFIESEQRDIDFFFDKFILDYPYFHEIATGKKVKLSSPTQKRLDKNLTAFNNSRLLASEDFKDYARSFLRHKSSEELKKPSYKKMDNQRLNSVLQIIPRYFTDQACRDFWQYDYLNTYIEDWGVKNLEQIVAAFTKDCRDTSYTRKINTLYEEAMKERKDHLIETYKTVDGFKMDIHLFLPDSPNSITKRPVFVYFSGGSWTKGNPEWAFYNCGEYAKKGWVGVSVEYRLADRQSTTPFESVMDARSAIRWLRKNAARYNIDTNRIVASGNSAGGHLVLATALADKWNEKTDDLQYSPTPNLLLVNAGVYDFINDPNTAWVSKELKDKNTVKEISPVHLVKKGLPPMLIIHGTNDQSVTYATAKAFETAMKNMDNDFEFHTLESAPHAIWFDRRFTKDISTLRSNFLKKHGYQ